jgi:predicted metal-binding membrane protein
MADARQFPMPRERNVIVALLLVLAAAAWIVLIRQSRATSADPMVGMSGTAEMPGMEMPAGAGALTMGMSAPLFIALWVVMMVAMMFPSAVPMTVMFARVASGKRSVGQPFVPTWVFVLGYLAVWTAFGVVADLLAVALGGLAARSEGIAMAAPRIGGAVLVLAGAYQLSPLKQACLKQCRSPFHFIATSWREGYGGALRMGAEHGAYCVGCCWMLMVILFPLGMTNVAAVAPVALLIFAEKAWLFGVQVSRAAAAALVLCGVVVIAIPSALPTAM